MKRAENEEQETTDHSIEANLEDRLLEGTIKGIFNMKISEDLKIPTIDQTCKTNANIKLNRWVRQEQQLGNTVSPNEKIFMRARYRHEEERKRIIKWKRELILAAMEQKNR